MQGLETPLTHGRKALDPVGGLFSAKATGQARQERLTVRELNDA